MPGVVRQGSAMVAPPRGESDRLPRFEKVQQHFEDITSRGMELVSHAAIISHLDSRC